MTGPCPRCGHAPGEALSVFRLMLVCIAIVVGLVVFWAGVLWVVGP